MKRLLVISALLCLAVPTAYAAPPAGTGKPDNPGQSAQAPGQSAEKNAAKKCKAELKSMGAEAFKTKYGTNTNGKNAFGKCVSAQVRAAEAAEARENAAKKCKAELKSMGAEAFKTKYGTNENGANAFGKCVSKLAKQQGATS